MDILNSIVLPDFISAAVFQKVLRVGLIIIIGYSFIRLLSYLAKKFLLKGLTNQSKMVIGKGIVYTGVGLLCFVLFSELGIHVSALLGAAGVLGLVIGIASQTSIGNIISGIFLISEKTFEIGDSIRIGDKSGVVYSIDLLSIKLKTFDNLLIRIPNQQIISSDLVNVTRFPIRRFDLDLSVAYKEDLGKVKSVLEKVAKENLLCLDEPQPLIMFKEFGDHGIHLTFAVWFEKANFLKLRNSIFQQIKEAFEKENIEIPFPHVSLYTGSTTEAFPVKYDEDKKNK